MTNMFVKLHGDRLLSSTLWLECWQARLVFIGMLAAADWDGIVDVPSVRVLARKLNLSVEDTQTGLAVLEAPDPESRSPEENGCRVVREGSVWRIVNHTKYREIQTKAQAKSAARSKRWRDKLRGVTDRDGCDASRESRCVRADKDKEKEKDLIPPHFVRGDPGGARADGPVRNGTPDPEPGREPGSDLEPEGPTAAQIQTRFRRLHMDRFRVDPYMGGDSVHSFPERLTNTARAQGRDPLELLAETYARWNPGPDEKIARNAPYASFAARFGSLCGAEGGNGLTDLERLQTEQIDALARGDRERYRSLVAEEKRRRGVASRTGETEKQPGGPGEKV